MGRQRSDPHRVVDLGGRVSSENELPSIGEDRHHEADQLRDMLLVQESGCAEEQQNARRPTDTSDIVQIPFETGRHNDDGQYTLSLIHI